MVGNLEQVFQKATQRYLDQQSSSDDEIAVEFPKSLNSEKPSKRKPTLVANTDKKRDRSVSSESSSHEQLTNSPEPEEVAKPIKGRGIAERKVNKPSSNNVVKKSKVEKAVAPPKQKPKPNKRKNKLGRKPAKRSPSASPLRSRSPSRSPSLREGDRWSSSPPPSWPPSSPETRDDILSKRKNSPLHIDHKSKTKGKTLNIKFTEFCYQRLVVISTPATDFFCF